MSTQSNTPETDEEFRKNPLNDFVGKPVIQASFARQLERQRDAALAELKELQNSIMRAIDICTGHHHDQMPTIFNVEEALRAALDQARKL